MLYYRTICQGKYIKTPKTYDCTKETIEILYVDKNSLYGEGMCEKLPQSGFQVVLANELNKINWKDSNIGNMMWDIH